MNEKEKAFFERFGRLLQSGDTQALFSMCISGPPGHYERWGRFLRAMQEGDEKTAVALLAGKPLDEIVPEAKPKRKRKRGHR